MVNLILNDLKTESGKQMNDLEIPSWDCFFMSLAHLSARKSKDRSTKSGSVIVGPDNEVRSLGYNGFPRGFNDDSIDKHSRPDKYYWTEHTERNAIYNATRVGIPLKDCKIYITWFPCHDCARAIASVGIREVIVDQRFDGPQAGGEWDVSKGFAKRILEESGITFRWYDGPLINIKPFKGGKHIDLEFI